MKILVKFYNKKILMSLNEHEMKQSIFSLCLEALKRYFIIIFKVNFINLSFFIRINEEIILTNNKMHIQIFKEPEILLYSLDKVFDVLDNNDTISIVLSNLKLHKYFFLN
jgi:hypothetical protein